MSNPLISIIIPCFNGGADLPETLASLEGQTFKDVEILVVDDGSTDSATLAYLQSLPPAIRRIRQENKGLPAARNAGMRQARGQFLLPLDCDDRLEPSFLAEALQLLQARPDAAFVFAQMRLTGELQGVTRKSYNPFVQLFLNQLPYCLLMRKSAWESLGGYDETFRSGYEDWEFNIRLSAAGLHGVGLDAALFIYRVRSGGMLNSLSRQSHAQLWQAIQNKHPQLYRLCAMRALRCKWRAVPLAYPAPLLFGLLAAHRLLPFSWFNALYARLLAFSAARRAG
ncbi:MAG: glycosyltransferase family 2 protein [Alphaproteobacteria bacterium]|nr:glycosyltransferase family 2 protein [Alphaproteobacteria bacterium]